MIKTAELTGAQLDYWVARAEGHHPNMLSIRNVPRTEEHICVLHTINAELALPMPRAMHYSEDCRLTWPLLEMHEINLECLGKCEWLAEIVKENPAGKGFGAFRLQGSTSLEAICRAIVFKAFGEEVEEVLPC